MKVYVDATVRVTVPEVTVPDRFVKNGKVIDETELVQWIADNMGDFEFSIVDCEYDDILAVFQLQNNGEREELIDWVGR